MNKNILMASSLVLGVSGIVGIMRAQAPAAAPTKVGVIQIQAAIVSTKDGQAAAEFSLKLSQDVKPGEIGGWISIESGPVLALRRWSATIVQPKLEINLTKLDFGTLIQGQKRTLLVRQIRPLQRPPRAVRQVLDPLTAAPRIQE